MESETTPGHSSLPAVRHSGSDLVYPRTPQLWKHCLVLRCLSCGFSEVMLKPLVWFFHRQDGRKLDLCPVCPEAKTQSSYCGWMGFSFHMLNAHFGVG